MTVQWTSAAKKDLTGIVLYLIENDPEHATDTSRQILHATAILSDFPYIGRPGSRPWTRELVLSPLPYILIYIVTRQTVRVLRVLHGKQNWKE